MALAAQGSGCAGLMPARHQRRSPGVSPETMMPLSTVSHRAGTCRWLARPSMSALVCPHSIARPALAGSAHWRSIGGSSAPLILRRHGRSEPTRVIEPAALPGPMVKLATVHAYLPWSAFRRAAPALSTVDHGQNGAGSTWRCNIPILSHLPGLVAKLVQPHALALRPVDIGFAKSPCAQPCRYRPPVVILTRKCQSHCMPHSIVTPVTHAPSTNLSPSHPAARIFGTSIRPVKGNCYAINR
jgi:hypothetical protein